ncbi:MFS general substrate transporter [Lentinula detonsa]|uniref:MFS general substrate transporter n=1 Tax=Lentinula detonsa TaxID=2804962 RepID=A0A9W8NX02_9AGAR|nr:MFS general substrate transporter [Lentinula detonsa]
MVQFAALCWCFILEGWNDGSIGPLLPVIQAYYSVGFAVVSLLFVVNCCVMVLGSLFQLSTYAIQSPAPPFPALVLSFFLAGLGSDVNAQANGFVGSLKKNKHAKLMMLHASYGLGAFCSPLLATHFSQTRHWSFHYIISCGIAVSNTAVLCVVFRFKRQEDLLRQIGQEPNEELPSNALPSHNLYRQIFNIQAVHFLAIFAFIYVGVEVTIGGWIVTFIIRERDGGPSAGYISSGFFGGLTIGRLALMYVNKKVGEQKVVFIYVSFIGALLGPLFPILVGLGARILPPYLFTGGMGWITGVGTAGSAALPFVTGMLASKYGIKSLQPFLVVMMCTLAGIWAVIPKARRTIA